MQTATKASKMGWFWYPHNLWKLHTFVYFNILTWRFHSPSAHTRSGKATLPSTSNNNPKLLFWLHYYYCHHLCICVGVVWVWVWCGCVGIGIDSCLYLVGEGLLDVQSIVAMLATGKFPLVQAFRVVMWSLFNCDAFYWHRQNRSFYP